MGQEDERAMAKAKWLTVSLFHLKTDSSSELPQRQTMSHTLAPFKSSFLKQTSAIHSKDTAQKTAVPIANHGIGVYITPLKYSPLSDNTSPANGKA